MNAALSSTVEIKKGLEGVIADSTSVSDVDGDAGRLYYRGYTVEALTGYRFTDVAHLIVFGELPDSRRQSEFEGFLWEAGKLPKAIADLTVQLAGTAAHPMEILQAAGPLLAADAPSRAIGRSAEESEGLVVAARLPALLALIAATRTNRNFVYSTSRRYGERFLHMVTGVTPAPKRSTPSNKHRFCSSIIVLTPARSRRGS